MRYLVVVEPGESSFGAYVPDPPGCFAVGESRPEVLHLIGEAMELHLDTMRQDDSPVPQPQSTTAYVQV